ncbi:hypothetical protein JXB28_01975 [Candidatus Woesearchaeota archaeon]|nr:hypothetical protein [Candidatus Woesearchaeota archaeon]
MKNKQSVIAIIIVLMAFILVARTYSASISGHSWAPAVAYTNNTLNCSWTPSGDATGQNITILKDAEIFNDSYENASEMTLSTSFVVLPENTSKSQVWTCRIIVHNETDSYTSERNITVTNTPPTTEGEGAGIFYNGNEINYLFTVLEDNSYTVDVNATDADNDYPLDYKTGEEFCTRVSQETGIYSCLPTQSYITGNQPTLINISFIVSDYQNFGGRTVTFNITPVNDAPQFSPALSNQEASEGQTFNYNINGTDEEGNYPFNFTISSSPALEIVVVNTSNTTATIMLDGNRTASYYEAGNYTINVTIRDSQGANSTGSFNLTITQVNIGPILEYIGMQNSSQGQPLLFYIYANDNDVNNTLNFTMVPTACSIDNPWNISILNNSHNGTAIVNETALTNDHVICRQVRITVIDDNGAEDFEDVFLNISNTNDPPNVEVLSSNFNNTGGNNISNLVAYAESQFIYVVNATDIDIYTYESEVLSYTDNSSFFDINSTTGVISFTPGQEDVGVHIIIINATDDGGLSDYEEMHLTVIENSAPELMSIGNFSCEEDSICFFIINATDADNDDLNFTSNNSAVFSLTNNASESPITSAYLNFTPEQADIGVYSVIVTVSDTKGATDTETVTFTINNTNDAPELQSFTFTIPIVETHGVSFYIYSEDEDYSLSPSYEYLTFGNANLTGRSLFDVSTLFNSTSNKTYGQIVFTPEIGDAGNYSVNVSVTDYYGEVDWVVKNFTVEAKTFTPNITQITPHGRPYSNDTNFSFTSTSNYASNMTSINFSENRSVVYNVTVTDDTTSENDLRFTWYINGSANSTSRYINISYGLFSSRKYDVTLVVTDYTFENSSWTWNVTVDDINRVPSLINDLLNLSVNSTTVYTDYLKKTNVAHFLDPDDDLNSNNDFEANETSYLTYDVTNCTVAEISIINHSIRVVPETVGTCIVYFTAEDYLGLNATSNPVSINVTSISNATEVITEPSSGGGGGGGGSSSKTITIPITKPEEIPKPLELVVPTLVTIYKNETVIIPIVLQNNWNSTLQGIRLNATTNDSSVGLEFSQDYYDNIIVGEKKNTTLIVKNYRLGENYEVRISANVTTPLAGDTALVMLNSIEQAETGEQVETKVTFAQDLLSDNPECAELNELLFEAKKKLEEGSSEEASNMVDGVINGCKYLVSVAKKTEQKPQSIISKALEDKNLKSLLLIGGAVILGISVLLLIKKHRAEKREGKHKEKEGKKAKDGKQASGTEGSKEEIKPYWP